MTHFPSGPALHRRAARFERLKESATAAREPITRGARPLLNRRRVIAVPVRSSDGRELRRSKQPVRVFLSAPSFKLLQEYLKPLPKRKASALISLPEIRTFSAGATTLLSSDVMPAKSKPKGDTFGALVRRLREERDWSQPELSLRCGISVTSIWAIETGKTQRVRRETKAQIARAFDVTVEQLDARELGDKVANTANSFEQRVLLDRLLSLPADRQREVLAMVDEIAAEQRKPSKRGRKK